MRKTRPQKILQYFNRNDEKSLQSKNIIRTCTSLTHTHSIPNAESQRAGTNQMNCMVMCLSLSIWRKSGVNARIYRGISNKNECTARERGQRQKNENFCCCYFFFHFKQQQQQQKSVWFWRRQFHIIHRRVCTAYFMVRACWWFVCVVVLFSSLQLCNALCEVWKLNIYIWVMFIIRCAVCIVLPRNFLRIQWNWCLCSAVCAVFGREKKPYAREIANMVLTLKLIFQWLAYYILQ